MWDAVFKGLARVGAIPKSPKLFRRVAPSASADASAAVGVAGLLNGNSYLHLAPTRASAAEESGFEMVRNGEAVTRAIASAGGCLVSDEVLPSASSGATAGKARVAGIVCDARHILSISDMVLVFEDLKRSAASITPGGAVVFIGADSSVHIEHSAVCGALAGFTKSLAKELALRGVRVNMLALPAAAEVDIAGALPFLLSNRSAYITGQVLPLSSGDGGNENNENIFSLNGRRVLLTGSARGIGENHNSNRYSVDLSP